MKVLRTLLDKKERTVIGLMSGTSIDGVDAAICRLANSGSAMEIEALASTSIPFTDETKEMILRNSSEPTSSVKEIAQLNTCLAHLYADAALAVSEQAGLNPETVDLVGSHGQTLQHLPAAEIICGRPTTSTLQVGDGSIVSSRLKKPVVSDFRTGDMAMGGQGAPLVPYFDFVRFSNSQESRLLINIGGIANLTYLRKGGSLDDVTAFDTGPGNMLADLLAQKLFGQDIDRDGAISFRGTVRHSLLGELQSDEFLDQPPPRSTGRERYGKEYGDWLVQRGRDLELSPEDIMATTSYFTAWCVLDAYTRFVRPRGAADAVLLSGGGYHNKYIVACFAKLFEDVPVKPVSEFGVDPDAKEALCFAVLAHEFVNGVPTNVPAATGARGRTLLGKLSISFTS